MLIELTPELVEIFNKIKRDSKLSGKELVDSYGALPEYQEIIEKIKNETMQLESQIKESRSNNPQMNDEKFFQAILTSYGKKVIETIKQDYKDKLTPEIIARLDKFSLVVINDPEKHGDMTAHPEEGKISINKANFAKDRTEIEGKIARAMATMPHELFHFVYRILKDEKSSDERMVYNLSNGDTASCLGMVGHMLNEGFVEKMSSEFCQRNGIYYSINPSYIQFTKLCEYIMKQNKNINDNFLIHNNYSKILANFSPDSINKYKETERIEYLNNFKLKTKNGEPRKVAEEEVVSSYNEKVTLDFKKVDTLGNMSKEQLKQLKSQISLKKAQDQSSVGQVQNSKQDTPTKSGLNR